jgi:hypothetical protein
MTLISYLTETHCAAIITNVKTVLNINTIWGGGVEVFDAKRAGRNNKNSGLKGFASFEIATFLIFVNINPYRPY